MGNQVGQISQGNNKNLANMTLSVITDGELIFLKDHNSSYHGVKTPNETDAASSASGSIMSVQTTDKSNEYHECMKIPTLFEWKEGGKVVALTGSFSNWSQWHVLNMKSNGNFEITLDLQRGVYQYKFLVDNMWSFSKYQKTVNDGKGNINNIIDTTNYVRQSNEHEKGRYQSSVTGNTGSSSPTMVPKCNIQNSSEVYSQIFPPKTELYSEAPNVPLHYARKYNQSQNTCQLKIGHKSCLSIKNKSAFSNENTSSRHISLPSHVNLNHLSTKCGNKIGNAISLCSSHHLRNKCLTFVYYKPVKNSCVY